MRRVDPATESLALRATWGHSSRRQDSPARRGARSRVPTPRAAARRSCGRRGAARRGCHTCRAAVVVHDQRFGDRLCHLLEPRSIAFRLPEGRFRPRALASIRSRSPRPAATPCGDASPDSPPRARFTRSRPGGTEDEGPEPDQVAPPSACRPPADGVTVCQVPGCVPGPRSDRRSRRRRRRPGAAIRTGRQPDDRDGQHEQHDVRQMAPTGPPATHRPRAGRRRSRRPGSPPARGDPPSAGGIAMRATPGAASRSRAAAIRRHGSATRRGSSASGCSPRAISASRSTPGRPGRPRSAAGRG